METFTPPSALQGLLPLLLLAVRLASLPWSDAWRDWLVILSVYWVVSCRIRDPRRWSVLSFWTASYLFVVYQVGQIPQTLKAFGWNR